MQVAYYMYFTPRKMKVENGKPPTERRMRGRGSLGHQQIVSKKWQRRPISVTPKGPA